MKKTLFLFLAACLLCGQGNAFTLSPEAEISLLTCSPGNELYSLFGHTAIRVKDPAARFDRVFNYGTFDFDTPYFYLKYARGLLPYQLSHTDYRYFLHAYREEGRSVYEQRLRLDSLQKQRLLDILTENYRPENRSYLYNFLFDNCTTRSRDVILQSLADTVDWHAPQPVKSFWNLLDEYLFISPWVQWGIHTILGQGGNRTATAMEAMFLPDYLMSGLERATLHDAPFAEPPAILSLAPARHPQTRWYLLPAALFTAGFLLTLLLLRITRSRTLFRGIAATLFLFSGLVGCLIVFLGAFTAHPITAPNWNILWANPLNLLMLPFIWRRTVPPFVLLYFKAYIGILAVALPAWLICRPAVPMASLVLIVWMIFTGLLLLAEKTAGKTHKKTT